MEEQENSHAHKDFRDEEEVRDLIDEYDLDFEEAEETQELIYDEGLSAEEAIEIREFTSGHSTRDGGWIGGIFSIVFIIILVAWTYNHYTSKKIENSYGYKVETNGVMDKPDCTSLEPSNPYDEDSGHYSGYEWGMSGKDCGGNSDSFIEGCEEYQNQENAYQYCLNRSSP